MKEAVFFILLTATSVLAREPAADAALPGLPVIVYNLSQDGEDEPDEVTGVRPFYAGDASIYLQFEGVVEATTGRPDLASRILASTLHESETVFTETLEAPGDGWILNSAARIEGSSVLILQALIGEKKVMHFYLAGQFEPLASQPLDEAEGEWSFATKPFAIERARIYALNDAFPEPVQRYLPTGRLTADQVWWRDFAYPADQEAIELWRESLSAALANDSQPAPHYDVQELPFLRSLIEKPAAPLPESITGDWQVRSIQVDQGFIVAYPWFKARIVEHPESGRLFFEKMTGSQRKSGFLDPSLVKDELVFLGGATVNEDPQIEYSGWSQADQRKDSDTAGVLFALEVGRLVMVLDARDPGSWEVYELKR
ncbi:MAG: DUF4893 domain-containing protein [Verrucomicrobiales bacterium]